MAHWNEAFGALVMLMHEPFEPFVSRFFAPHARFCESNEAFLGHKRLVLWWV